MAEKTDSPVSAPVIPDSAAVTPALQDKGLWVALIATVLAPLAGWLSMKLGIAVDPTSLATFIISSVLPLITYIVMHKYKSGKIIVAETTANANVAATQIQADAMTGAARAAEILNSLFPNGLSAGFPGNMTAGSGLPSVSVPTSTFATPPPVATMTAKAKFDPTSAQAAPMAHALPQPTKAAVELAAALNGPVSTLTETLVPTMPSLAPTPAPTSAVASLPSLPEALMQLIPGLTREQADKMSSSVLLGNQVAK